MLDLGGGGRGSKKGREEGWVRETSSENELRHWPKYVCKASGLPLCFPSHAADLSSIYQSGSDGLNCSHGNVPATKLVCIYVS